MLENMRYVLGEISKRIGKRLMKEIVCTVLLAFGIAPSVIHEKLGVSYKSLRRYREYTVERRLNELLEIKESNHKSVLEKHKAQIEREFETKPPRTLKEAKSRIKEMTGISRSVSNIRRWLKKGASD